MPLQFRRGHSDDLPPPSDAAVGEPLFTTDDGKLRIKKANGQYVVINDGSASENLDLSGIGAGSLVKVNPTQDGFVAAAAGDLPSHSHAIANVTGLQSALDGKASTGHTHTDATTSAAGFMSASDKTKLDGVAAGAQVNTVTSVAGRTGAVSLTSDDVGLGSVPNTDTTNAANITSGTLPAGRINDTSHGNRGGGSLHAVASTSVAGFMSAADKTKLDGIPTLGTAAEANTGDFAAASHAHGNVTSDGKVSTAAGASGLVVQTGTAGAITTLAAGTSGQFLKQGSSGLEWGSPSGNGTVTSVDLSVPSSLLGVSGNPVTGSGTLAISLPNRDANAVFAGPTTGSAAAPSFRSLVADDIPNLAATKITSGQIPSAVTFDTADLTGFSNAVASRLLEELPTSGGVLDIAQESTLIGLSDDIDAIEARSITAGTGLTGGGTLAESRTLAVDFATTATAGKAVEANDSRLSNERTPVDGSVSTAKIADDAVTADKIADNAVGSAQIADAAVTMAKIAQSGATTNQVIKWNGTAWAPADDAEGTGTGLGAPTDAEYLVKSSNGGLSAERVVTDSTSITADWATSGQVQLKRAALTGDVIADANSNTTEIVENAILLKHIADNAVSYGKIQDVSATDKILGRSSAGAGDIEEITCTAAGRALLDDADAAAQRTTLGAAAASHTHGNLTNDGKIASAAAGRVVSTTTDGAITALSAGTTGQYLKQGSSGLEWDTPSGSGGIGTDTFWNAKGNLAVGTADNTASVLSAGTDGWYLRADSTETTGLEWGPLAVGTTSGLPIKTGTGGTLEAGAFGTGAGEFAQGNHTHTATDSYVGHIETAANKTYRIDMYAATARTITDIRVQCGSGSCSAAIKNGSNTVGTVSVSTTSGGSSPSLSNTSVSANGTITLEISSNSDPAATDVWFVIRYTETI